MFIYLMVLDTEEEKIKFVKIYDAYKDRMHYTASVILKDELNNIELNKQNSYFIEINPMPTIEIGNNFHISFENITETNSFYKTRQFYKDKIKNPSPHGFILSCALINKIISKHKKQKDLSYTFQ